MFGSSFAAPYIRAGAIVVATTLAVACTQVAPTPSASAGAARPDGATLKIASPSLSGSAGHEAVKVSATYAGPKLIPGADAKKLDDYHLHYFLDEDASPFIDGGRSIPMGNPHIVHSAATEVSFENLAAGQHTITVVMTGNNHVPVTPTLSDTVSFTSE
jgi:hypothetical protein